MALLCDPQQLSMCMFRNFALAHDDSPGMATLKLLAKVCNQASKSPEDTLMPFSALRGEYRHLAARLAILADSLGRSYCRRDHV